MELVLCSAADLAEIHSFPHHPGRSISNIKNNRQRYTPLAVAFSRPLGFRYDIYAAVAFPHRSVRPGGRTGYDRIAVIQCCKGNFVLPRLGNAGTQRQNVRLVHAPFHCVLRAETLCNPLIKYGGHGIPQMHGSRCHGEPNLVILGNNVYLRLGRIPVPGGGHNGRSGSGQTCAP